MALEQEIPNNDEVEKPEQATQAEEVIQAHSEKWDTETLDFSIYSQGGGIHNVDLRSYKELQHRLLGGDGF